MKVCMRTLGVYFDGGRMESTRFFIGGSGLLGIACHAQKSSFRNPFIVSLKEIEYGGICGSYYNVPIFYLLKGTITT